MNKIRQKSLLDHGGRVLMADSEKLIFSRGLTLFELSLSKKRVAKLLDVAPLIKRNFLRIDLIERLTRNFIQEMVCFENRLIFVGSHQIFTFDLATGVITNKSIPFRRPLNICVSKYGLAMGEYRSNPERGNIKIWTSSDGLNWQSNISVPEIRHIHSITYDEFDDKFIVCCGDYGDEARIITYSSDWEVQSIIKGDQRYRCIACIPLTDKIIFGTDTEIEKNEIFKLDRSTKRISKICDMPSSVFYGVRTDREVFFSTAVEPSETNETKRPCIVKINIESDAYTRVFTGEKDIFHPLYFGYGSIKLIANEAETLIYASQHGLQNGRKIFTIS